MPNLNKEINPLNKYHVNVSDTDALGIKFFQTCINLAQKGATLKEDNALKISFPRSVWFEIITDEFLESDILQGLKVIPVEVQYTKEMLEAMDWETFKNIVQAKGIRGRQREVMQSKYLKACETGVVDSTEE